MLGDTENSYVMRRHATAVCVKGEGVLLLGESGVGKTDLALRLIANGATLIADDQVDIFPANQGLHLSPPASLAGVIELRGIGLIKLPHTARSPLRLVVQCISGLGERLPPRRKWIMEAIAVDEVTLDPLHVSSPAKIQLLVAAIQSGTWLPEDWMADSHQSLSFCMKV